MARPDTGGIPQDPPPISKVRWGDLSSWTHKEGVTPTPRGTREPAESSNPGESAASQGLWAAKISLYLLTMLEQELSSAHTKDGTRAHTAHLTHNHRHNHSQQQR